MTPEKNGLEARAALERPQNGASPLRTFGCLVVLGAIAIGVGGGIRARLAAKAEVSARAEPTNAPRRVVVVTATAASTKAELALPGAVEAVGTTTVIARTSGVVRERRVDIGARVLKGDLLAVIDAAEVGAELRAAEARERQARASLPLAERSKDRLGRLAKEGAGTQQEAEDAQNRLHVAKGALESDAADVARLRTLVGYQKVVAPFDGTITRREVEVGASVVAGQTRLFDLATTDELFVATNVPQWLAERVRVGSKVVVASRTGGVPPVQATVSRTAGALDPGTRTLRVEVLLPKASGLLAGAYVNVKFSEDRGGEAALVPASTLSLGAKGTRAAVVDASGKVAWRVIEIRRDLGKDLEISKGVQKGDRVILYPAPDLSEGEVVEAVER